jgi:oligo-1,6-glucosidase
MDEGYKNCNEEVQLQEENSILRFYQKLIAFRKEHKVIYYGDVVFTNKKEKDIFTYYRKDETETLYIEINLSSMSKKRTKSPKGICLLSNYEEVSFSLLRPYEASIWKSN